MPPKCKRKSGITSRTMNIEEADPIRLEKKKEKPTNSRDNTKNQKNGRHGSDDRNWERGRG